MGSELCEFLTNNYKTITINLTQLDNYLMLKRMLGTHKPLILFLNYADLTYGCGITLFPMHCISVPIPQKQKFCAIKSFIPATNCAIVAILKIVTNHATTQI